MRKSNYGQALTFHWEGFRPLNNVQLVEVASTLRTSEELDRKISEAWEEHLRRHPDDYDGKLWRLESVKEAGEKLAINVSPITFSQHAYLRQQELPEETYPNPLGITALQVTRDGYAIAGEHFDGRGIVPLESRFIERRRGMGIMATLTRHDKRETLYGCDILPDSFLAANSKAIGIATGSLHDTGIIIYVQLPFTHEQASTAPTVTKYKEGRIIPVRTDEQTIRGILETGQYHGKTVADQLIGSLELFLNRQNSRP